MIDVLVAVSCPYRKPRTADMKTVLKQSRHGLRMLQFALARYRYVVGPLVVVNRDGPTEVPFKEGGKGLQQHLNNKQKDRVLSGSAAKSREA